MGVTAFGKILRKRRIDSSEILGGYGKAARCKRGLPFFN